MAMMPGESSFPLKPGGNGPAAMLERDAAPGHTVLKSVQWQPQP
jgi:hypothetical protein